MKTARRSLRKQGGSCWRSKSAGVKARSTMRWNHSSAMSHPPECCTRLRCSSCRKGRLAKASIGPALPSGHVSRPRTRHPRAPCGAHTWARIIVLLVLLGLPAGAQEPFPAPQGRVNDFAQVLDPATKAQLNALVEEVEQRTTAEIAVVVVHTTASPTRRSRPRSSEIVRHTAPCAPARHSIALWSAKTLC